MEEDISDYELVFMPGSFDGFDGTQEELDELIASIKKMIADGSLFENAIDIDLSSDDAPPEVISQLQSIDQYMKTGSFDERKKKLN